MWDAITSGLFKAGGGLALAAVVYLAFDVGRMTGRKQGLRVGLLSVLGACLLVAAIAAVNLGSGTCLDDDPIHGSCADRADDGFTPTREQRGKQFVYVLCLLLAPAAYGIHKGSAGRRVSE